jgi:hypothetical protein
MLDDVPQVGKPITKPTKIENRFCLGYLAMICTGGNMHTVASEAQLAEEGTQQFIDVYRLVSHTQVKPSIALDLRRRSEGKEVGCSIRDLGG